jgi:hypothetical protein
LIVSHYQFVAFEEAPQTVDPLQPYSEKNPGLRGSGNDGRSRHTNWAARNVPI